MEPNGKNALKAPFVNTTISNLLGEILTIIDASVEGEKNKALKSLIRTAFSDKQNWITELSYKEQETTGEGHHPPIHWEEWLVPFVENEVDKVSFKV